MMMRIFALTVALMSAPAMAAEQQFDLTCKAPKGTVRYRVDLAAGEWCAGSCERVAKIADVTSGMLTLERKDKAHARDSEALIEINRTTGEWYTFSFDPALDDLPFVRKGKCEPATFSGPFPSNRKF